MKSGRNYKRATVLLTRHRAGNRELEKMLRGLRCKTVAASCIEIVTKRAIFRDEGADWVIFTSVQSVLLVPKKVIRKDTKIAVVGEGTKKAALRKFSRRAELVGTSGAEQLYGELRKHSKKGEKLVLFGAEKLHTPVSKIRKLLNGRVVKKVTVYQTRPIFPIMNKKLEKVIIPFFSPSAVAGFSRYNKSMLKEAQVIAFGSSTKAALVRAGYKKIFTLSAPTRENLLDLLRTLISQ